MRDDCSVQLTISIKYTPRVARAICYVAQRWLDGGGAYCKSIFGWLKGLNTESSKYFQTSNP